MIKRMRDWKIPVVQTVVLCVVAIVLCTMDVNAIVMGILQYASIEINELPVECRLAISFGPRVLSGIIWLAFLWVIRRFNAIDILNKGSDYHDHYYVSYCFCRYVLGYKKCCLTRVPIYMQFKLVLADLFPEYLYTDGIHELESDMISVVRSGECNDTVNLIISDTYRIDRGQLPGSVQGFASIYVGRQTIDKVRYHNEDLVKSVVETVRSLPPSVVNVNVFATTNPWNTYDIAKEAFATGSRDAIERVYVFQQSSTSERVFSAKGKRVL